MQEEQHIKVQFRYYSDILEEEITETLWAIVIDAHSGLYKLDSIPFYGPAIATDDIFYAEFDAVEEMMVFKEVREPSGNSIIQVALMQEPFDSTEMREKLSELGCLSEVLNDRFFAAEVPAALDYTSIKHYLDELEASGKIEYAEPVLSENHASG